MRSNPYERCTNGPTFLSCLCIQASLDDSWCMHGLCWCTASQGRMGGQKLGVSMLKTESGVAWLC